MFDVGGYAIKYLIKFLGNFYVKFFSCNTFSLFLSILGSDNKTSKFYKICELVRIKEASSRFTSK